MAWLLPLLTTEIWGSSRSNPGIVTESMFAFPTESVPVRKSNPEKLRGGVKGFVTPPQVD
jgi:hypothetical protein